MTIDRKLLPAFIKANEVDSLEQGYSGMNLYQDHDRDYSESLAVDYLDYEIDQRQVRRLSAHKVTFTRKINSLEVAITTPQAVANFFLDLAKDSSTTLTPLRLIKLVCIAHGWCLAILNKPLFQEKIEAWSFGPVVPSLYHEFKDFRKDSITRYAMEYSFTGDIEIPRLPVDEPDLREMLRGVWATYKGYSASELVTLTHQDETPWSKARAIGQSTIRNQDIRKHYLELLEQVTCE